ncbi:hypothetical protein JCM10207_007807 [Rhodosporidiobolus poonsookiae]
MPDPSPTTSDPPIASSAPFDIPRGEPAASTSSPTSSSPTLAGTAQHAERLSDEVATQPGGGKDEAGPTTTATRGTAAGRGAPPAPAVPYTIHSQGMRWFIVTLVALAGLFSPLSANIYFPVIPSISDDLGVTVEKINISVTVYMIFQGLSPSFFGAICDVLGRRPVYILTFIIYLGACAGLANTHVYWLLLVLRCVQAAGSASVIAIGSGSIGDIAPPSERGMFMSIFGLGPMVGPCIGPIAGGLLADHFGWQSLFWFLFAFGAVVLVIITFLLPETLRSLVGNGSIPARGINRSLISIWHEHRRRKHADTKELEAASLAAKPPKKGWKDVKPFAPLKMFREKDVLLTLSFNSACYTLFYCVTTSTGSIFKSTYGLNETELGGRAAPSLALGLAADSPSPAGLVFIANGAGCLIASFVNGPRLTHDYRVVQRQVERKRKEEGVLSPRLGDDDAPKDQNDLSTFPIERARLRSMPVAFFLLIASTIVYGWVVDKGVHMSVPLIMQFIVGISVTSIFNSVSTLLVDLYPGQSASATAANNLYRCLCGAAGTGFVDPLLNRLGAGWGFTMLSLLNCLFVPLILLEWRYGMRFRLERAARLERLQEKKDDREREKGRALERRAREADERKEAGTESAGR